MDVCLTRTLPTHAVVCQGHLALEAGPGIGSQSIHLEETLAAVWPTIGQALRFYDWIDAARSELLARGETPLPLKVEPSGAEIAKPIKDGNFEVTPASMPDPDGRVQRAAPGLMEWRHVTVSHTQRERRSIRVHMQWQPAANSSVEWNNEAEPLTLWLEAAPGWKVQPAFFLFLFQNMAH